MSDHPLTSPRRFDYSFMAMLFVGNILLRLAFLLPTGFDGLYGQDAYAYYDFAQELRSALSEGRAPGSFFWPLGYPALLAIEQALLNTHPQTAQLINILMGSALAPLVYYLARQLGGGRLTAFTAGIIMGLCGQALQSSLVLMADIPALFWGVVSAVALWHFVHSERSSALFICGLTLALASITRWLYLVLAIPWLLTLLIVWRGRIRWRASLLAAFAALLVLVPQLVYSRTNPNPVLNHAWVEGWSPANAFARVFDNVDGHFEYATTNLAFYTQPFYEAYYLAPVFTPFMLLGLWDLYRRKQVATLTFLLPWGLLPMLFLVGIPYQNIRFPLIVFPAVAILAGFGLGRAADWLKDRYKPMLWRAALGVILIVGAAGTLNASRNIIGTFIANQQRDKEAAAWTAANVPAGETLYAFGLTLTLKHYTALNVYEIFYETPETLAEKWGRGQDDYLLLNVWSIENQWVGLTPEIVYEWFREQRGLTQIGRFQNYTLFKVSG
jgi:4-amino-4-deoxy-L-arabinose transferase-like glycosyltransferase